MLLLLLLSVGAAQHRHPRRKQPAAAFPMPFVDLLRTTAPPLPRCCPPTISSTAKLTCLSRRELERGGSRYEGVCK